MKIKFLHSPAIMARLVLFSPPRAWYMLLATAQPLCHCHTALPAILTCQLCSLSPLLSLPLFDYFATFRLLWWYHTALPVSYGLTTVMPVCHAYSVCIITVGHQPFSVQNDPMAVRFSLRCGRNGRLSRRSTTFTTVARTKHCEYHYCHASHSFH